MLIIEQQIQDGDDSWFPVNQTLKQSDTAAVKYLKLVVDNENYARQQDPKHVRSEYRIKYVPDHKPE